MGEGVLRESFGAVLVVGSVGSLTYSRVVSFFLSGIDRGWGTCSCFVVLFRNHMFMFSFDFLFASVLFCFVFFPVYVSHSEHVRIYTLF